MEEVWIKTEPVDVESSAYFHIKYVDDLGTAKAEPTTPIVTFTTDEVSSEAAEITFNECERTTHNNEVQLTNNVKQNTTISDKPFHCIECGARYASSRTLQAHLVTHTGTKPFCCNICDKTYVSKHSLIQHERWHTGAKPFACDICGSKFGRRSNLNTHKRIHTWAKLFTCKECGLKFMHSYQLKQHKKQHTGQQPKSAETVSPKLRVMIRDAFDNHRTFTECTFNGE